MLLLTRMERIQEARHPLHVEEAMADFTCDLLQLRIVMSPPPTSSHIPSNGRSDASSSSSVLLFNTSDETLLYDLHTHGAIVILLNAMKKFWGRASPEFYNSATMALVHLCYGSQSRSDILYQQGALSVTLRMMQVFKSLDYIQIIGMAMLTLLGTNVSLISCWEVEHMIIFPIVQTMEHHFPSSKVYVVACTALRPFLDAGTIASETTTLISQEASWYSYHSHNVHDSTADVEKDGVTILSRLLFAVTYGLLFHLGEPSAQSVGHALLSNMMGPDAAHAMITKVALRSQDCTHHHCAAAA